MVCRRRGRPEPILPKWRQSLPVVALRAGNPLPAGLGAWILGALAVTEEEAARHELVDLLRRHADSASLDRWTADVLCAWISAGSPLRQAWLVPGVALLGGAAAASVLRDAVRRWSKDREQVLATRGLDALGRIDDPAALAAVAALAAGAIGRGVTREAQREVTKRAEAAGTSPDQLTDRHVPTGGLDPRGERSFRVGARSFRAVLGKNLELALFEENGRRRVALPRPSPNDDPATADASRRAWMESRTEVRRVAREQARRFERLMVGGRVWTLSEFQEDVLAHPILGRIARLLVWRCDDDRCVRVAEDGSFADAADQEVGLDPARRLQLMHPLRESALELTAWSERFADYGLVAPFPQIGRETSAARRGCQGRHSSRQARTPRSSRARSTASSTTTAGDSAPRQRALSAAAGRTSPRMGSERRFPTPA